MNQDDLLELVSAIYAAGADPALWPETLAAITDAMGGNEAVLAGASPRSMPWVVALRTDPAYLATYQTHYHARNPFAKAIMRAPPGKVVLNHEVVGEDFYKSEFFNDWCRPQRLYGAASTTLVLDGQFSVNLVVNSPTHFEEPAVRVFRTLLPHLANAFKINQRLAQGQVERSGLMAVLDTMGEAVIMVDDDGRILFANALAEAMLARRDVIVASEGRIGATGSEASRRLHRLIKACAANDPSEAGGRVTQPREPGRSAAIIEVVPFRERDLWALVQRPAALVIVNDPELKRARRMHQLEERFGLTPAEAAYALEVIKGDGREAAAARRGITVGTGRTHLSRIFEKTGVRRQAELVRVLIETWQAAGE